MNFSDFSPELLAAAPECPIPVVTRWVRAAVRELCEQADCYRHEVTQATVTSGTNYVDFGSLPTGTQLHKPIGVSVDGNPLEATSLRRLGMEYPDWRTLTGTPTHYYRSVDTINRLMLFRTPDATLTGTDGLDAELALVPTRTSTSVEDIFADRFYDTIVDGALAKILKIRSALWYNPQLAQMHEYAFLEGVKNARALANGDDLPKRRLIRYGGY